MDVINWIIDLFTTNGALPWIILPSAVMVIGGFIVLYRSCKVEHEQSVLKAEKWKAEWRRSLKLIGLQKQEIETTWIWRRINILSSGIAGNVSIENVLLDTSLMDGTTAKIVLSGRPEFILLKLPYQHKDNHIIADGRVVNSLLQQGKTELNKNDTIKFVFV